MILYNKGGQMMKITMTFESDCIKSILEHNLIEQVRPILGISEVLDCLASNPEIVEEASSTCIYTGNDNIRIVLEVDFSDDVCNVYVNDIILLDKDKYNL